MAIAALDTGKHVICEKPLALSAADADAMAAAAKAAQGLSTVNLPFRQMSPVWAMQKAVARDGSGFVGASVLPCVRRRGSVTLLDPNLTASCGDVNTVQRAGTPRRVDIRFRFPLWPRAWQIAPWVGQKAQGGPLRCDQNMPCRVLCEPCHCCVPPSCSHSVWLTVSYVACCVALAWHAAGKLARTSTS